MEARWLAFVISGFLEDEPDELLLHDDMLLPSWQKFVDALASVAVGERGIQSRFDTNSTGGRGVRHADSISQHHCMHCS